MPHNDPFSGLHLSEQSAPAKLDQRLFAPEPTPAPAPPKPAEPTKTEQPKKTSQSNTTPVTSTTSPVPKSLPAASPRFDLQEEPLYKASFLFCQSELEALEDLKLELKREYDAKVTKNSLIRAALHLLFEDHAANKTHSYASHKVGQRETR